MNKGPEVTPLALLSSLTRSFFNLNLTLNLTFDKPPGPWYT
jgi:hypothetical protein